MGNNLSFLLTERFAFLVENIDPDQRVLEVGAGQGTVRSFLPGVQLIQTDVHDGDWLDAVASAEALPFADGEFDALICIAAIHHMDYPLAALKEFSRVIRPGGKILILEPHASWLLRRLLSVRGHEYVDESVDPFGPEACQRNDDNWDGNNVIGDLIFDQPERLKDRLPELEMTHRRFSECVLFMNSGGVNHKAPHVPLPMFVLKMIRGLDGVLCNRAPDAFALVQEVVLWKAEGSPR